MVIIAALYKFTKIEKPYELKEQLLSLGQKHNIKGTLIVAQEGINGTIAGTKNAINTLKKFLAEDKRFDGMEYKEAVFQKMPFLRFKVPVKKEIVTLGQKEANPNNKVGIYLDHKKWNNMINDPDTLVIDVRNDYEVKLGTFKNAVNPKTENFRDFVKYVDSIKAQKNKKIAMFCTGGIRCEKASSYMLEQGFKDVFHLKGGILKYFEDSHEDESLFNGECFVFDDRVSVKQDLSKGDYDLCHGCRYPIHEEDKKDQKYIKGISCPNCFGKRSNKQVQSATERQKQIDLAKEKGIKHLGYK